MENKKVVQQCPRCSRTYKNLSYCAKCKTRYCSDCSIKGRCADCYVVQENKGMVADYELDKHLGISRNIQEYIHEPKVSA